MAPIPQLLCSHGPTRGRGLHSTHFTCSTAQAEAKLAFVVVELEREGATKPQLEKAFKAALATAYQPAAVAPPAADSGELRAPATASDAQARRGWWQRARGPPVVWQVGKQACASST